MFASTNLVFELGIVLWVFLGPAFTAAGFAGGLRLSEVPAAIRYMKEGHAQGKIVIIV